MPNAGPTMLWRPRLVSKTSLPARVSPIPEEKAMQVFCPTTLICLSVVQGTTQVSEDEDNSVDEKKKAIIESDIGLMLHLLHMFGSDEHVKNRTRDQEAHRSTQSQRP